MPDPTSGSMTRVKICHSLAPSTRADCSNSTGSSAKNARMKNVPNEIPVEVSTRIAPGRVSSRPIERSWKYSGIMNVKNGTSRPRTTR